MMTFKMRRSIEEMYRDGVPVAVIAARLGKDRGTIYYELKKGTTGAMDENGRPEYSADVAQGSASEARVKRMLARQQSVAR